MNWRDTTLNPIAVKRTSKIEHKKIRLAVDDHTNGKRWMFLDMAFGDFSEDSYESCQAFWPSDAIAKARQMLDELEAELAKEEPCEAQAEH